MKAAANEIIREKRMKLGLSQRDLAKKAGVSHNTVYNVENAKGTQSLTTYKKICDALGIKVSSVLK
ncbi:MAG: helix-turn-helix transcriptional regulator [Lachnospiraceae bacterium]|nr:helix-turn-helix transcriptional regulator [Lachnospiraceae bacterium]